MAERIEGMLAIDTASGKQRERQRLLRLYSALTGRDPDQRLLPHNRATAKFGLPCHYGDVDLLTLQGRVQVHTPGAAQLNLDLWVAREKLLSTAGRRKAA